MSSPDFQQDYFELFALPADFALDQTQLGVRYRQLQGELHPDRFAGAAAQQQRLAVQYSAYINEAYATLKKPLTRALYLLHMAGLSEDEISRQQIDGGFLILQMELREKLESIPRLVDPDNVLDHLLDEIGDDIAVQREKFGQSFAANDLSAAATACVKMQYLDKLLQEVEQIEADLMDK